MFCESAAERIQMQKKVVIFCLEEQVDHIFIEPALHYYME